MNNGPSGVKRKAPASELAVLAKRSTSVVVPGEVTTLLSTVAASLNAATLELMELQCSDVAARDRAVAVMAECKRHLNDILCIERRLEYSSLNWNFLQRWIMRAEVTSCRHKLTLDILTCPVMLFQDTTGLDAYTQDYQYVYERRFGSVSGRRWAVMSGVNDITFKINHDTVNH